MVANRCISEFIVQNAVIHYCVTYVRGASFIWASAGNDSSTVPSLYGFSIT